MDAPLDELYFNWLYKQVANPVVKNPNRTYWRLFKLLFTKEFVWLVPNDDNRVEDGKDLRYEFIDQSELTDVDPGWIHLGCSMLEMLVAVSRRLTFEADGRSRDWFWHLMDNLDLRQYNDHSHFTPEEIGHILDRVIWRTYKPSGEGGLFPLNHAERDQTKVEIWYQASAYLIERM